ncbi:hypothetical protein K439DRAFT_1416038 [Ramaria rubella]|nr:hypothetical protein K439DRAFT_1420695 [Ramaria rubella]KAF8579695.1 hypothetical protein K439DRAFT_1416038 [Ramaria rubella]
MSPLSEKAKGKQRADTLDIPNPATPRSIQRDLTIRFTEGVQDLIVSVGQKDSVRDIKNKIRSERAEVANRRLRLIHSGRLLTDGTLLYPWLVALEERQRRAHSKEEGQTGNKESLDQPNTWLHCSVGPVMEVGEEDDRGTAQTTQISPLRGFDRLQAAGFSAEDIASIRRQFHSEASNNLADTDLNGEDFDEHARALEEQWIDSIDTTGSAALSQSSPSTSSTVLQGLLLGFFFPVLPFFFFREPRAPVFWDDGREAEHMPSVVFTKRMQMAIVIGFVLNITFGIWRFLLSG